MGIKRFLLLVLALVFALCDLAAAPASAATYDRPYYIELDLTNQIVTIYNTKDKSIARQMLCSAGMNDATITGVWYMPERQNSMERKEWYYFRFFRCYAKWATRYYYNYFFHSITFNDNRNDAMNAKAAAQFGVPASHGCVRLRVEDAEFIAKNCLTGTRVEVYKSGVKDEDLRQLLYISSYTGEDGMSYSEFLGISEDSLGRGSSGAEVSDLQYRMSDLGYYDGEVSGRYDNALVGAVKGLQKDLGLAQTGITSKELEEVIFSDEAPVAAGQITINEGKSGPVVKKLQEALQNLGLYTGPLDGVYDVEVSDAIKAFQKVCGYTADGVATPEVQQLVYYELNKVREQLGEGEITASVVNEEITMATVKSPDTKIIVREQPSTDSAEVGKVSDGDTLMVTGVDGDWAAVSAGAGSGYVKKKYLSPYTETNPILTLTSASSGQSITLGNTIQQRQSGAADIKTEFSEYYASEQFMDYMNETVTFCAVNTGSDDVSLNLRAAPSGEAEILAKIPNGTKMRVLSRADGWTKVGYDEEIGYLMDDYLTFWEGLASEVESTATEKEELTGGGIVLGEGYDVVEGTEDQLNINDGDTMKAVVVPDKRDGRVNIYAEPSENSEVIKRVKADVEVEVVSVDEDTGWVTVKGDGDKLGYMLDVNLSLRLA